MTAYELMIKTNQYLITGGKLSVPQKKRIVDELLGAISPREQAERFYEGVRFPGNIDSDGRQMYPIFFIPPYNNGKKYPTVLGQMPKTHILSANAYELEILRLLYILTGEDDEEYFSDHWANEEIVGMTEVTLERLKTTCFGSEDDGTGECFDTSLVVLRYLAAVHSSNTEWIYSRIDNYYNHVDEKHRMPQTEWYFRLCLSELPEYIARREIYRCRSEMTRILEEGLPMRSENDWAYNPLYMAILQNTLGRLPEYAYLKTRKVCTDFQSGRLMIAKEE